MRWPIESFKGGDDQSAYLWARDNNLPIKKRGIWLEIQNVAPPDKGPRLSQKYGMITPEGHLRINSTWDSVNQQVAEKTRKEIENIPLDLIEEKAKILSDERELSDNDRAKQLEQVTKEKYSDAPSYIKERAHEFAAPGLGTGKFPLTYGLVWERFKNTGDEAWRKKILKFIERKGYSSEDSAWVLKRAVEHKKEQEEEVIIGNPLEVK